MKLRLCQTPIRNNINDDERLLTAKTNGKYIKGLLYPLRPPAAIECKKVPERNDCAL